MATAHSKRIGVIVPPANPTVEPEVHALLPATITMHATRLPVLPGDLQARTDAYADHYPAGVRAFGSLALDALYIACTGPSYRLGPDGDRALAAKLAQAAGVPVLLASLAILAALEHLGARQIVLVSPYPKWLTERSVKYWQGAGLEVTEVVEISETFRAYELTDAEVSAVLERVPVLEGAPVVLSGTGMSTLAAIRAFRATRARLLLSSNLCGVWAALAAAGALGAAREVKHCAPELFS